MDILIALTETFPSWFEQRGKRVQKSCDLLSSSQISAEYTFERGLSLIEIIENRKPKVVFNELIHIDLPTMEVLVKRFPKVQFVTIFHHAPSFPLFGLQLVTKAMQFEDLAKRFKNAHVASVMPKGFFQDIYLELPNLITPREVSRRDCSDFVVSIICRTAELKNISGQIFGVCEFKKREDIALVIVTDKHHLIHWDTFRLTELGIPFRMLPWQPWHIYLDLVDNCVDVGLQCSLTESFNLVAAEHMQMGKPVLGSNAIDFLPKAWQAVPHDKRDFAEKLLRIKHNLPMARKQAREIAVGVRERNNAVFLQTVDWLLNR